MPDDDGWLEFSDLPDVHVEWIWHGYLARRNLTLLSAEPKMGKSTLLFDFLKKMNAGQPCLGLSTTSVPTALLTEESLPLLKMRRDSLDLSTLPLSVFTLRPGLTWPLAIARLKQKAVAGAKLLVVDTLSRFWGVADENDAAQVVRAMAPLVALTRAHDAAVLIIHHVRKAGGPAGRAVRGSNALTGAVDISIDLTRMNPYDKSNRRRLESLSRYGETPDTLYVERADTGYDLAEEQTGQLEQELLRFISGEAGVSADDVAEALFINLRTAQRCLTDMVARDILQRDGSGSGGSPYRYSVKSKEG